jgi:hypothetical protein
MQRAVFWREVLLLLLALLLNVEHPQRVYAHCSASRLPLCPTDTVKDP